MFAYWFHRNVKNIKMKLLYYSLLLSNESLFHEIHFLGVGNCVIFVLISMTEKMKIKNIGTSISLNIIL